MSIFASSGKNILNVSYLIRPISLWDCTTSQFIDHFPELIIYYRDTGDPTISREVLREHIQWTRYSKVMIIDCALPSSCWVVSSAGMAGFGFCVLMVCLSAVFITADYSSFICTPFTRNILEYQVFLDTGFPSNAITLPLCMNCPS